MSVVRLFKRRDISAGSTSQSYSSYVYTECKANFPSFATEFKGQHFTESTSSLCLGLASWQFVIIILCTAVCTNIVQSLRFTYAAGHWFANFPLWKEIGMEKILTLHFKSSLTLPLPCLEPILKNYNYLSSRNAVVFISSTCTYGSYPPAMMTLGTSYKR